jgi:hypothetical protein
MIPIRQNYEDAVIHLQETAGIANASAILFK